MRYRHVLAIFAVICVTPLSASQATVSSCPTTRNNASFLGDYPDYHLSPKQSLTLHDAVFLGEVVVPSRKCSLGYCAGLRVVRNLKGTMDPTVLIQVRKPDNQVCAPLNFANKGERWLVFANQGTSRKGHKYFYSDDQGPSFPTKVAPDFDALEDRYQNMRISLDKAIRMHLR